MRSLILILVLCLSACSAEHLAIFPNLTDEELINKNLSVEQMHEDVDYLVNRAIEIHPDMASYANIPALKREAEMLKAKITQPMKRVEFYYYVGQISHHFNDGHSFLIWPYQEYNLLKDSGKVTFPFDVTITPAGEVFVNKTYISGSRTVPAGAKVISVNNVSVSELVSQMQKYVGGETAHLRQQIVARRFSLGLWAVFDFVDNFSLQYKKDDEYIKLDLAATDNWQASEADSKQKEEHYYRQLTPEVGYLYLSHFDVEPSEFEDFIDQSFATIKQQNIQHLLIDIRNNPGGNTDTVSYLSQYLANKPFRLVKSLREKLNSENRGWFNYKGQVGETIEHEWDDWVEPIDNDNAYKGETYLAIGAISYSAAIVLATTLQDNQFATLIGEATGGYANQTAQGNLFNLPNSQLRAYVATRLLVRPSGDLTRQSVIPDVEINQTASDIEQEKDVVVDWLLKQVKLGQ